MGGSAFLDLPSVQIKTASLRYFDEFLKVKCSPDLCALEVFPNAKEITESFAAYNAVRKAYAAHFTNEGGVCIVIGDGNTPRTGAVFAYRSRWQVYSIDPRMKMNALRAVSFNPAVKRLYRIHAKIEEAWDRIRPTIEEATFRAVVAVHSHAPLVIPDWVRPTIVVAMPCCVPQVLPVPWSYSYEDWGVHSPKRKIYVWREGYEANVPTSTNGVPCAGSHEGGDPASPD